MKNITLGQMMRATRMPYLNINTFYAVSHSRKRVDRIKFVSESYMYVWYRSRYLGRHTLLIHPPWKPNESA